MNDSTLKIVEEVKSFFYPLSYQLKKIVWQL